jgi:N-acetylglutamate synthase-like GNAT family acetyltransferase
MNHKIISTDSEKTIKFLEDRIYEYNSSVLKKDNGNLFSFVIRNEDGKIIGGIAGWTWANACEITQLWIDESMRKAGLGKSLLESAETEAKQKGCNIILIKSYEFQAPHFYEKHGYIEKCVLQNFPEQYNYFLFTKSI